MINSVNVYKQDFYPRGQKTPSYSNSKMPNFKGLVEATTSVLQYCNTNPMAGVSLIDLITAIAPRTIVDAKTNGFAAAETCRRESSGLIVNCLIPGFVVLGVAKLLEAIGSGPKGIAKLWANQDALETLRDHYKQSGGSAKEYVSRLFSDAEVLKGKEWIKLNPQQLETELSEYAKIIEKNITDSKTIKIARQNLYQKILSVTGGAEHIKMLIFPHSISPFADQLLILFILHHFSATPWAFQHLKFIVVLFCISNIVRTIYFEQFI